MLLLPESTSTETVKASRDVSLVVSALTSTVTSALVPPSAIVTWQLVPLAMSQSVPSILKFQSLEAPYVTSLLSLPPIRLNAASSLNISLNVSVMVAVSPSAIFVLSLFNETVGNGGSAGIVKFKVERLPVCTMFLLPESTATETVKASTDVSLVVSALTSTVTSALVAPAAIVTWQLVPLAMSQAVPPILKFQSSSVEVPYVTSLLSLLPIRLNAAASPNISLNVSVMVAVSPSAMLVLSLLNEIFGNGKPAGICTIRGLPGAKSTPVEAISTERIISSAGSPLSGS